MKRMLRRSIRSLILVAPMSVGIADCILTPHVLCAQESAGSERSLVTDNAADEPRFTPITRPAMKQYIEDLKNRTPRIPLPALTEEDKKRELESPRNFGYESRLRSLYVGENSGNGYGGFWGSANSNSGANNNRPNMAPDPALTLDYAFKVQLFWIAARANNCQYCLGHQESKLLAAGMTEDSIAALDSDWDTFSPKEQVAFALAKRMTNEPHLLTDSDVDACRKHYSDLQILEMIGSIAGSNAINRWKEGAGIPQSSGGGNFGGNRTADTTSTKEPSHSYLTPTSNKFLSRTSKVAFANSAIDKNALEKQIAATKCVRPTLETGAELQKALDRVATRKPRLPLVSETAAREVLGDLVPEGTVPQWMRLMANFPVAGKRFVSAVLASQKSDELSPKLQAEMDWVIARQDRAWYAASLAHDALKKLGTTDSEMSALDGDISLKSDTKALSPRDLALLTIAKNVAASPIVLTDSETARAIEIAGPKAVTQAISYTTYRAAFDRITEAAGLSK